MGKAALVLVVASFREAQIAENAFRELKFTQRGRQIELKDAALVERDSEEKIHIKETADPGGGKGATFGGIVGALIGLIAGPAGVVVGAATGAVVGGVAGKKIDSGISDERLEEIGQTLTPGTGTIVTVVEEKWTERVQELLIESGAEVIVSPLRKNMEDQLKA